MVSAAGEAAETANRQMNEVTSKIEVKDLSIYYTDKPAIEGVTLDVKEHEIFGIIGPANAGKTSFLKSLNRMDMFTANMKVRGDIAAGFG